MGRSFFYLFIGNKQKFFGTLAKRNTHLSWRAVPGENADFSFISENQRSSASKNYVLVEALCATFATQAGWDRCGGF
jgi:hypothetical protein